MRWAQHVTPMGDEKCIQYFGWKTRRKRPLRRPRHSWEDNIRLDLREVEWMHLAQDKDQCQVLTNAVMNLQAP